MLARRVIAGFLAGASGLAGLLLLLVLLLVGFGLLSLVRELAIGQQGDVRFWSALGTALGQTLRSLPGYFWSARWGLLVLGVLGIILALSDTLRPRIRRRWRDQLGLVITAAVVSATVVGGIYAYREVLYTLITDRPELSNQQDAVLTSTSAQLALGVLAALALTYLSWASWSFWYERWSAVLGVTRPPPATLSPAQAQTARTDDWREQQQRMARLRRGLPPEDDPDPVPASTPITESSLGPRVLAGLALTTVLLYFLARAYDDLGPGLVNAGMWVTADQPSNAVALSFPREPTRMVISNIGGSGTVRLRLSGPGARFRQVDAMRLPDNPRDFVTEQMNLRELTSGEYILEATLQNGQGGLLNYAALYGGGLRGRLLAAALGLAAGVWAALATIGLLEALAGFGHFGRRNISA